MDTYIELGTTARAAKNKSYTKVMLNTYVLACMKGHLVLLMFELNCFYYSEYPIDSFKMAMGYQIFSYAKDIVCVYA